MRSPKNHGRWRWLVVRRVQVGGAGGLDEGVWCSCTTVPPNHLFRELFPKRRTGHLPLQCSQALALDVGHTSINNMATDSPGCGCLGNVDVGIVSSAPFTHLPCQPDPRVRGQCGFAPARAAPSYENNGSCEGTFFRERMWAPWKLQPCSHESGPELWVALASPGAFATLLYRA